MKFGGSSLRDAAAMAQCADIVRSRRTRAPVVVASATSGVTDSLIHCARTAHRDRYDEACQRLEAEIAVRHRQLVKEAIQDRALRQGLRQTLDQQIREIDTLLKGLAILGELTPRSLDALVSYGERLSTLVLTAALHDREVDAEWVDAREFLITDDRFNLASPLMEQSEARAKERLAPMVERGCVPVTQGFVGSTADGRTTTLGRGGSDYSAAVLGTLLGAREIEIWTDVDGIMTADPQVVPDARPIPVLSYAEAAELAYFGAKVLHPKTVTPAVDAGIPIAIRNTFSPEGEGSRIVQDAHLDNQTVKAITAIGDLSLITVAGRGMLGVPGVAARVFSAVAREEINVLMISQASSEQSICLAVEQHESARAVDALKVMFEQELLRHNIDRVQAQENVAIVAAVGAGMKGTPGIAARVFGALGARGINVISIAQGSSEYNLSLVVKGDEVEAAMRHIHEQFELGREAP